MAKSHRSIRDARSTLTSLAAASGAAVALLFAAGQPARAADDFWNDASGGSFTDGTKWSLGNPPGASDRAVFGGSTTVNAVNTTGVIAFPSSGAITNDGVDTRNTASGTVTLDLNGSTYTLDTTTPIRVGQTATTAGKLIITDGVVRGPNEAASPNLGLFPLLGAISVGTLGASNNELEFNGGAVLHAATNALNVGTNAAASTPGANNVLRFTGVGTSFSTTTLGSGTSLLGASTSTLASANTGLNNAIIISNGASFTNFNYIYVGGSLGGTAAPDNLIEIDNATYFNSNNNRGIVLRDGTLRIKNNASVTPGLLNMIENPSQVSLDFQSGVLEVHRWRVGQNSTHTIGDGTGDSATYRTTGTSAFMGVTTGVGNTIEPTSAFNLVLNTDARMEARGTIAGSVSALGAGATATMDFDAPTGRETLTVTGNWNNQNIDLTFKLGDFPTELATDIANAVSFTAPRDVLEVGGLFTHGGSVTVDLQYYVAPEDQNYDIHLIQSTNFAGIAPLVTFINGDPLAYTWEDNGLHVIAAVPEPGAVSILAMAACGVLARRRRARAN